MAAVEDFADVFGDLFVYLREGLDNFGYGFAFAKPEIAKTFALKRVFISSRLLWRSLIMLSYNGFDEVS
jgi:hypothetical protein